MFSCVQLFATPWTVTVCMLLLLLSCFSRVQLRATPRTAAHQAPLSTEFPRHEYWSGLSFPFPGDLSNPGIKPMSPGWQADSLPLTPGKSTNPLLIFKEWDFFQIQQEANPIWIKPKDFLWKDSTFSFASKSSSFQEKQIPGWDSSGMSHTIKM